MSDTVGHPTIVKKGKGKEGSAGEERAESPIVEKQEDDSDKMVQIAPGTARHSALMKTWKAPSGGKVVKMGHKTAPPKPTKT